MAPAALPPTTPDTFTPRHRPPSSVLCTVASPCALRQNPRELRDPLRKGSSPQSHHPCRAVLSGTPRDDLHAPAAARPVQALASFQDFASQSNRKAQEQEKEKEEQEQEQSEQQLRDFLRGGDDVAEIMQQMATLLEDIQGFEQREETMAVEMAAAAAVAGRLEVLDRSFLLALDYMMQQATKQNDSRQAWLLQMLKQQVLFQLESKFPPQVEVVSLLVTTPEKEGRLAILRRSVAAASLGANKTQAQGVGQGTSKTNSTATATVPRAVPAVPVEEQSARRVPSGSASGGRQAAEGAEGEAQERDLNKYASAVYEGKQKGRGTASEVDGEEESQGKAQRRVPAAPLNHIIAQADDLIAFMEEELPIRDRKLLARLVLAREEARGLMAGGFTDERNDVRGFQNLPEAEVRFLSQLAAIRAPKQLHDRIVDVMRGQAEGLYHQPAKDGKAEGMPWGAPVRPGHFMDSVTKVISGIYKTGGSGVLVQQLERVRNVTLEVLQEIGHS